MYNGYCNLNKSRGNKMNLTEQQMIEIIKNKQINDCSEEEKKQVMIFAFGEDYMESNDKSSKKTYEEA